LCTCPITRFRDVFWLEKVYTRESKKNILGALFL
jgi:hypothetical protein